MSVVHANTVAAMSGHMLHIWGAKFQSSHRKMGLEDIFDQVMELVFNTAKQLQYAANAWIVGPIGGGRFIRQSEYLRNLRLSRPLPILRGPRVMPTRYVGGDMLYNVLFDPDTNHDTIRGRPNRMNRVTVSPMDVWHVNDEVYNIHSSGMRIPRHNVGADPTTPAELWSPFKFLDEMQFYRRFQPE